MKDEIPEDYYLKYPKEFLISEGLDPDEISKEGVEIMKKIHAQAEGNTGVENLYGTYDQLLQTCKELQDEIEEYKIIIRKKNTENAAIIAALKELIPIAEFLKSEYPIDFFLYFKESAIERAKKLI